MRNAICRADSRSCSYFCLRNDSRRNSGVVQTDDITVNLGEEHKEDKAVRGSTIRSVVASGN